MAARVKMQRASIAAGSRRSVATDEVRPWAELHPDLLSRITDGREMSLVGYASVRAVCNPWRSTIPPATPLLVYTALGRGLLTTPDDGEVFYAAAFSLPAQRRLVVRPGLDSVVSNGSDFVGSGYNWLAIDENFARPASRRLVLMNPISGMRIVLPELMNYAEWTVNKVVFAPNPSEADFTAVAIYGRGIDCNVGYARSGDEEWTELPHVPQRKNTIIDLVYHEDGRRVYCLTISGAVRVLHLPRGGETEAARVERLLPDGNGSLPFDPATVFEVPGLKRLSYLNPGNNCKSLVFCEGNMYQVWRNLITIRTAPLLRELENRDLGKEIIVLRYEPGSWPCWREVDDLGGCSVFIGKNNAVSFRADGKPWLRANCVYWIGGPQEAEAMVFDMATQITTPFVADGGFEGSVHWASCWYVS